MFNLERKFLLNYMMAFSCEDNYKAYFNLCYYIIILIIGILSKIRQLIQVLLSVYLRIISKINCQSHVVTFKKSQNLGTVLYQLIKKKNTKKFTGTFYVLFKCDLALFKNNEKNTCEIFLILDQKKMLLSALDIISLTVITVRKSENIS